MMLLLAVHLILAGYDVFADDLHSPDGLAISPGGIVYVSEERAGRVTGFTPEGTRFTVIDGLSSPEGIAWDPVFGILVVEDVPAGRLVSSALGVLQENIPNPEGVVVTGSGDICYTWAHLGGPSGICRWTPQGPDTLLRLPLGFMLSGITEGPDRLLYACIETPVVSRFISVVQLNPVTGDWLPFASGIFSAEGLRFSPDGETLMVASESEGQIIAVDSRGETSVYADAGSTIEGILFLPDGSMIVTDDGRGKILRFSGP